MADYSKYKESAFTHEEMQPMIVESDMTDIVERLRSPANVFYEYAADKGAMLREAADEIERLREALRDCHHVLHKLMAIVPGNDAAVDEMAKVMKKARAALGEGKE